MHSIKIRSQELNAFDLPPVCVITGEREGVVFKPVKFAWYPRWVYLLIFANLIIALLVASAMTKRVKGELPFTKEAWSRWKRGQIIVGVSAAAAIALLFTALFLLVGDATGPLGLGVLALGTVLPVLAWLFFLRGKGPQALRIDKDEVTLSLPSRVAARAFTSHFQAGLRPMAWSAPDRLDANGAPVHAVCARHDDIVANWACPRCGAFMCPRCENRVRPEAQPLCPGCWELRARAVEKHKPSFWTSGI